MKKIKYTEEEILGLKYDRKILIASRDEAKKEMIEARIALKKADKSNYRDLLQKSRVASEIYSWFDYQVKEISVVITENYKQVWNKPKPRPKGDAGKKKKKKKRQ